MNFTKINRRRVFCTNSVLVGICLAFALPQAVRAQAGIAVTRGTRGAAPGMTDPPRQARMQREWQKMIVMYHITPTQQAKIEKMGTELDSSWAAISSNKTLTDAQKKTRLTQLATQSIERMNAVLTPEQLAKIKAMQAQRMKKDVRHFSSATSAAGMAQHASAKPD